MVGTQYQADVPSCLSHYKDGEKGNFLTCLKPLLTCVFHIIRTVPFWHWQFTLSCHLAYEDEDELLWSPGVIPESKVRNFLLDVLSRTTDEKLGCDKPGIHVRDNEQVCNVFIPSFVILQSYAQLRLFSVLIFILRITFLSVWLVQLLFYPSQITRLST